MERLSYNSSENSSNIELTNEAKPDMSQKEVESWQGENGQLNRGGAQNEMTNDARPTMSQKEMESWQGKDGEIYRGGAQNEMTNDARPTMSQKEMESWQGENGQLNRSGGQNETTHDAQATMSQKEMESWQGKDGEIYRGMQSGETNNQEEFGISDEQIGELLANVSLGYVGSSEGIKKVVDIIEDNPKATGAIMTRRVKRNLSELNEGNLSNEQITTDIALLSELSDRGVNIGGQSIDMNEFVGGKPELVPVVDILSKYKELIGSEKFQGQSRVISNPENYDFNDSRGASVDAGVALQNIIDKLNPPAAA